MSADSVLPEAVANQVRAWLQSDYTVHALAGDASVRAYFRITVPDGATYMLAFYPEAVRNQLERFLAASRAVAASGRAPAVLYHSDEAILQHDLGDRTLFDVLHETPDEGIRLYAEAVELLLKFQQSAADVNPPFTADFFENELAMTREFYVSKLMGAPDATGDALAKTFRELCDRVARHPFLICHRDFHGQNIHVFNHELYVIDYQDLRMGPDTYDLASLLRDRGVASLLGDSGELQLLELYRAGLAARGAPDAEPSAVRQRYFETLLQRSLKILGTFARQPIERGRMHYLDFIPAAIDSVRRSIAELPQFAELSRLFPMEFSLEDARRRVTSRL